MKLDVARNDDQFVLYQKKVYEDLNEKTRLEVKMAAKLFDYDLKAHLEQLESHNIKGIDFQPYPLKDAEHYFVQELMEKYIQEIKQKQKQGEFGRATPSMILRKCIKIEDIDYIVDDCIQKSI